MKFKTIAIAAAVLCQTFSALAVNVETYKYHKSIQRSSLFSVKVNGIEQTVLETPEPGICNFGCDAGVEVEVTYLGGTAESWALRPLNRKYPSSTEGNTIRFTLNPLDKAVVEVNGDETRPLFIFANPPEKKQKGATYYFKAGRIYKDVGTLTLRDGESIYIEGGAAVYGRINVKGRSNLSVDGCGMLFTPDEFNRDGNLTDAKKILFDECNNIALNNITVVNVSNWTTLFAQCTNIVSDNYKVVATFSQKVNGRGNENDGFDLLGSSYAKITNAFSYCHDDAFCVKSQKWNWKGAAHDIAFENCTGWNTDSGNTFEIGYELNQEVYNVSFRNMYAVHSAGYHKEYRRGAIGIQNGAGGRVHDISYENIYIEDAKEYGIYLRILESDYNIGTDVAWQPGYIYDIRMSNIVIDRMPKYGNFLSGYDSDKHAIRNLIIDGLYIEGRKAVDWSSFSMNNYSNIQLRGKHTIHIAGDSISAIVKNTDQTNYRGWGQLFPLFFTDDVQICDYAIGGRSTKTFIGKGDWDKAVGQLMPGDYILIQFGHNDESKEPDRGTTPEQYKENLTRFVKDAQAKGAIPVLITPILRRRYDEEGKPMRGGGDNWNHLQYSPKMFEVAGEQNVLIIDGETISENWLATLDPEKAKNYFQWFRAADYSARPEGREDNTHLNQKGAYEIATRFADALVEVCPELKEFRINPDYSRIEQQFGVIKIYSPELEGR